MKTVYYYSGTFEYQGIGIAQEVNDEVLMPPYATLTEPPATQEHEVAIYNVKKDKWTVEKDYRGSVYYIKPNWWIAGRMKEIGDLPKKATLEQPPKDYRCLIIAEKTQEVADIKKELASADYLVRKIWECENGLNEDTSEVSEWKARLAALVPQRKKIDELENDIDNLKKELITEYSEEVLKYI